MLRGYVNIKYKTASANIKLVCIANTLSTVFHVGYIFRRYFKKNHHN